MPDRTTIKGMGAAITLASFCTVREMSISGAESDIEMLDEVGTHHGQQCGLIHKLL